jgi:5'-deoxynucleotidase
MTITKAFHAGFVRRWHTNPYLAHTVDRIDGHSARVARIILMLHPAPSAGLLAAALIHDDGESVVGDLPGPFKANLEYASVYALDKIEKNATRAIWGDRVPTLTKDECAWMHMADRLDAYMWCAHHAPDQIDTKEWGKARTEIMDMARDLGCGRMVLDAV